jgi:hypothetical protein
MSNVLVLSIGPALNGYICQYKEEAAAIEFDDDFIYGRSLQNGRQKIFLHLPHPMQKKYLKFEELGRKDKVLIQVWHNKRSPV